MGGVTLVACHIGKREKRDDRERLKGQKRERIKEAASSLKEELGKGGNLTSQLSLILKAQDPATVAAKAQFQASFLARVIELLWAGLYRLRGAS